MTLSNLILIDNGYGYCGVIKNLTGHSEYVDLILTETY